MKNLSDKELIALYKKCGDIHAVSTLFLRYNDLIALITLKYLRNKQDAEDAAMDIFDQLCSDLKKHDIHNFKSWLYSVIKHHCFKLIRRKVKHSGGENIDLVADLVVENAAEDALYYEQRLQALESAIRQLKPKQKECIEMFYLEKISYKDIAQRTGYNLKKVKSYIQNGKRNISIIMAKEHE